MDGETKELLQQLKSEIGESQKLKQAVEQLEQQVKGIETSFEQKLKQVRAQAWDGNGRYRGVLASEDQARSFGLFVLAKGGGQSWAGEAIKSEYPDVVKAFGSSDAGNLIPEEYTGRIVDLIEQYGVFEPNAMRVPMSTSTQRYSKKTGRMSAAPMDEGNAVSETKPDLADRSLTAKKWGAYIEIPSEVSDDAVAAIGEMVASDMAEAFALAVDEAGFLGDGSSSYNSITGVVNALIDEAIVTGSGTAWGDLTRDNHLEVMSKVVQRAFQGNNAKWYCSAQYYWTVMAPIILDAGGVTAAEMEGRRQLMFLGFPVEITQVMPSSSGADQVAAIFGNLRQGATFGDRRQLTVRQSEHYKFAEDMIAMLGTRRFDINIDGAGTSGDPGTVEVLAALKTEAA